MTFDAALLSAFTIVKLALATWLFSHTLPRRPSFSARFVVVLVTVGCLAAAMPIMGFSVFPTLTDDFSFVAAVLQFVAVLAVDIVLQRALFSCSVWTSTFCCSMAYLLENLSSAAERAMGTFFPSSSYPPPLLETSLKYWLISAVVFAAAYLLLIRRIEKNGLLQISDPVMVVSAALVIIVNMVLDLVIKDVSVPDFALPRRYTEALSWIYILVCVYLMYSLFEIIYTRRLRLEVATSERLRAAEARQYELSRANIEAINLKCHDIKHQIRALGGDGQAIDERVLADMEREVEVYDSAVKSGNDALDTILTEKGLVCQRDGITLSCIADGAALGFMDAVDLYSLFGNALDNAIEAVERLDDPERRSVSVIVRRAGDMVSVHVENFFDGQVRFGDDGLPVTRKEDQANHGFGTRSMRLIVERYGGTISANVTDDVYHVNALIPLPA